MPAVNPSLLEAVLNAPVVLDGGLSNELERAGHDLSDRLWSARLLAEDPAAVEQVHRSYFRAGAQVAITASYQATFDGFARHGIDGPQTARLLRRSVELARTAAGAQRRRWVAASAGPYGAMLADGSEYRGRYGLAVEQLVAFHRPRLQVLAAAGPDMLALETVPDAEEAAALVSAVAGLGVPAWLSYSIAGGRTRAGQPLQEAFELLAEVDEIAMVGVNCCAPADVGPAVEIAVRATGKPVVVYPNSGQTWDADRRCWTGPAGFDPALVRDWVDAGARLVGGCCRVGPDAITAIAQILSGTPRRERIRERKPETDL